MEYSEYDLMPAVSDTCSRIIHVDERPWVEGRQLLTTSRRHGLQDHERGQYHTSLAAVAGYVQECSGARHMSLVFAPTTPSTNQPAAARTIALANQRLSQQHLPALTCNRISQPSSPVPCSAVQCSALRVRLDLVPCSRSAWAVQSSGCTNGEQSTAAIDTQ